MPDRPRRIGTSVRPGRQLRGGGLVSSVCAYRNKCPRTGSAQLGKGRTCARRHIDVLVISTFESDAPVRYRRARAAEAARVGYSDKQPNAETQEKGFFSRAHLRIVFRTPRSFLLPACASPSVKTKRKQSAFDFAFFDLRIFAPLPFSPMAAASVES